MFSALISFLGGSAFRMVWGEVSAYFTARQSHKFEIERLKVQGDLDAAQHERQQAAIKLQADMGIKVIEAQSSADVGKIEAEGWLEAVKAAGKAVGIAWVDAWNAAIRPGGATWAIALLTLDAFAVVKVSENTMQVCFAFLGLFVADRSLSKRQK